MLNYFYSLSLSACKQLRVGVFFVIVIMFGACSTPSVTVQITDDRAGDGIAHQESVIAKYPKDKRHYEPLLLDNGLQVLLVSDPESSTVSASLSVGVGSFQDPISQPGLAHYLEHMLFLGTKKYPKPNGFQKFITANAGRTNAYTASDHTNYFFSVDAKKADRALDQFSDYFKSPSFDRDYSEKERNAVNSEWSTGKEQDGWILRRMSFLSANPLHPGQQINVGNLQTLKDKPGSLLHEELLAFYQKFYSANIMTLALVGNHSIEELRVLATKHFSTIPNKQIERPVLKTPGLLAENVGQHIYYSPAKALKQLSIEFPIKSYRNDWQDKSYGYIRNLLSSEEKGTAGQYLREIGLINALYIEVREDHYGTDGVFRIRIDMTDQGLLEQNRILKTVFSYIKLVTEHGVNDAYFSEYKSMLENYFETAEQPGSSNLAVTLSSDMQNFPIQNVFNHHFVYTTFNRQRVMTILRSFTAANARIWHIYPQDNLPLSIPYYSGNYRLEEITAADTKQLSQHGSEIALQLPPLNPLFSLESEEIVESEFFKPKLIADSGNREVWLSHPRYHHSDKGFFYAQMNTDSAHASLANKMSAKLIFEILKNKLTSLTDRASRARLGVKVRMSGQDNIAFELNGPTAKHPELAALLAKEFKGLTINSDDFSVARTKLERNLLSARKNEPYQQLFSQFRRIVQQPSWSKTEQLETLQGLSVQQVQNYLKQLRKAHLLRVYAFGNYSEKTVMDITDSIKISDTAPELLAQKKNYITPLKNNRIDYIEQLASADNAIMKAYFSTEQSAEQAAAINVLNRFFRTELYTQLRTNEQLGYVVGSSQTSFNDYPGFVMYVQSDHADLSALAARLDSFTQEYFVQLQQLEEQDLSQLKQSMLDQLTQKPNDFYDEAYTHYGDFIRVNTAFDSEQKQIDSIKALRKETLIEVYKTLFLNGESALFDIRMQGL